MKPIGKRFAAVIAAGAIAGLTWHLQRPAAEAEGGAGREPASAASQHGAVESARAGGDEARQAFERRSQGQMLRVEGAVTRLLGDDRDGSPHQRFIIATDTGQTLLVAHNLDLAPRLDGLAVGERVSLYGEYEWNDQGGVMHWTHDDPQGVHPAGYIDWRGRRYQ